MSFLKEKWIVSLLWHAFTGRILRNGWQPGSQTTNNGNTHAAIFLQIIESLESRSDQIVLLFLVSAVSLWEEAQEFKFENFRN